MPAITSGAKGFTGTFTKHNARFVKVLAQRNSKCPDWLVQA